jgi:excinuclease UvrABC nuclease subunit
MVPLTDLKSLPSTSGIYKVLNNNRKVIYIGQAKNIYERWNNGHHKLGSIIAECGIDAYIDWVEIPEWLLNRAENAAISYYRPKLNLKTPPVV